MNQFQALQNKIEDLRFRGFGGTSIRLHRAIAHVRLSRANVILAVLLPLVFNLILLAFLGGMLSLWEQMFAFWLGKLAPGGSIATYDIDLGRYMISLSYPRLSAGEPSVTTWVVTLCCTLILFLLTFRIGERSMLPLSYIVRACTLIQSTALAYFYFFPGLFPHDAPSALADALSMSIYFLFLIPWILGLVYYVFDFSLWQKMGLTGVMLLYFAIALPMQYLVHALVLHHLSLLFLPLLYLVFGVFLDVMMFVALYSWGMSWQPPGRGS